MIDREMRRSIDLAQQIEVSAQKSQRIRSRLLALRQSLARTEERRTNAASRRQERSQLADHIEILRIEIEALQSRMAELTIAISRVKPIEIEVW